MKCSWVPSSVLLVLPQNLINYKLKSTTTDLEPIIKFKPWTTIDPPLINYYGVLTNNHLSTVKDMSIFHPTTKLEILSPSSFHRFLNHREYWTQQLIESPRNRHQNTLKKTNTSHSQESPQETYQTHFAHPNVSSKITATHRIPRTTLRFSQPKRIRTFLPRERKEKSERWKSRIFLGTGGEIAAYRAGVRIEARLRAPGVRHGTRREHERPPRRRRRPTPPPRRRKIAAGIECGRRPRRRRDRGPGRRAHRHHRHGRATAERGGRSTDTLQWSVRGFSGREKFPLFFSFFFFFFGCPSDDVCRCRGRFLSEFIEHFLGFHRDGTMCVSNDHNALKNFLGKLSVCLEVLFAATTSLRIFGC